MKRACLVGSLLVLSAVPTSAQAPPSLSEQALRAATQPAAAVTFSQSTQQQTQMTGGRRSAPAFWGGLALLAVGTVALLAVEQDCQGLRLGDSCLGEPTWPKGPIVGSAALMGGGLGLMLWGR